MWKPASNINVALRNLEPNLSALLQMALSEAPSEAFGAKQTHVGFLCAPAHEPELVKLANLSKFEIQRAPSSVLSQELGVQATILEIIDPEEERRAEVIFVRSSAAPLIVSLAAELGRAAHWALEVESKAQIGEVAQKIRDSSPQTWTVPAFSEDPLFSPQKGLWLFYMDDGYARVEITARGQ